VACRSASGNAGLPPAAAFAGARLPGAGCAFFVGALLTIGAALFAAAGFPAAGLAAAGLAAAGFAAGAATRAGRAAGFGATRAFEAAGFLAGFRADFFIGLDLRDLDGLPDLRAGCFLAIRSSSPP